MQLGVGSVGTLISHHLRLTSPSPISLLVRKAQKFRHVRVPDVSGEAPQTSLSVRRIGEPSPTISTGYDIEQYLLSTLPPSDARTTYPSATREYSNITHPPNGPIDSLIVTLKTYTTVEALSALAPRLGPSSVVTLLQNGMGMYDQLCARVFPDPAKRPFFVLGTTTHGVAKAPSGRVGDVVHNTREGEGGMTFGVVPDPRKQVDLEDWLWGYHAGQESILLPPASPVLPLPSPPSITPLPSSSPSSTGVPLDKLHQTLTALLSLSPLSPSLVPMPHLQHQLLLKLAMNSAINPLTSILGLGSLPNGALVACSPGYKLTGSLLAEASTILTAYIHSLHAPRPAPPDVLRLFSLSSLEARTLAVIRQTASNKSSMAADIAAGKAAEIGEINGYLVGLASRLGVPAPLNRMMVDMVKYISALSATYPSASVPPQYRLALKGTKSALKQDADIAMQERKLALEERKMDLEERMIRVKEDEALDRLQYRRRRKRAEEGDKRREGKGWYEAMVQRQKERGVSEEVIQGREERRRVKKQAKWLEREGKQAEVVEGGT